MKVLFPFLAFFLLISITMNSSAMGKRHGITIEHEYLKALIEKERFEEQIKFNNGLISDMRRLCSTVNQEQPISPVIFLRIQVLQDQNKKFQDELMSLNGILQWHHQVRDSLFTNEAMFS